MIVTSEQSIGIYARASLKWFGMKAPDKTRERIEQLTKAGDHEGARVHERVKQHILQLEQQREVGLHHRRQVAFTATPRTV